jgi:hypothetical protein
MPAATLSPCAGLCAAEQGTQQPDVTVRNRLSHTSSTGLCAAQHQLGQYLTSRGARVVQLYTTRGGHSTASHVSATTVAPVRLQRGVHAEGLVGGAQRVVHAPAAHGCKRVLEPGLLLHPARKLLAAHWALPVPLLPPL